MGKKLSGKRQCTLCKKLLPLTEFGSWVDKRDNRAYRTSRCKPCARKVTREWNAAHKDYMAQKTRVWREELRTIVYKHYGDKCICCGEDNVLFLTIDHINNDGYLIRPRSSPGASRKVKISGQWYKHIITIGFPDDLQLLCYNCNCGKQRNGGVCPHGNSRALSTTTLPG